MKKLTLKLFTIEANVPFNAFNSNSITAHEKPLSREKQLIPLEKKRPASQFHLNLPLAEAEIANRVADRRPIHTHTRR